MLQDMIEDNELLAIEPDCVKRTDAMIARYQDIARLQVAIMQAESSTLIPELGMSILETKLMIECLEYYRQEIKEDITTELIPYFEDIRNKINYYRDELDMVEQKVFVTYS